MEKTLTHHRRFIRIKPHALPSFMFIAAINQALVQTNQIPVLIDDISPEGLKFTTGLKLPVRKSVLLGFKINFFNHWMFVQGVVVWRKGAGNLFEYGVTLILEKQKRIELIKLLNDLLLEVCPYNFKIHHLYRCISGRHGYSGGHHTGDDSP